MKPRYWLMLVALLALCPVLAEAQVGVGVADVKIGLNPPTQAQAFWTINTQSGMMNGSATVPASTTCSGSTGLGCNSIQAASGTLTISATALGHAGGFWAGGMFEVDGSNLTATGMDVAGVIGRYAITGTNASTYAKGAGVFEIADGTTTADGAVVAVLGGDSSATTARAFFTVDWQSSLPIGTSYVSYGLDLRGPGSHNGYQSGNYAVADIRLLKTGGVVSLTSAITNGVTSCSAYGLGYIGLTSNGTGSATIWLCDATVWRKSA